MSEKLVGLIGNPIVEFHQGQRTYDLHNKAGHMTEADQIVQNIKKVLAKRPSTYASSLRSSQ